MPSLRDIEWQLVMHFSAPADISRLARCSKALLHAASSPFAWCHATARFDSSRHPQPRGGVATLARVHYLFKPVCRYDQDTDELIPTKLRVDHLDVSASTNICECWFRVLRSPMMQHVRQLTFPHTRPPPPPSMLVDLMSPICALPCLTTLDLGCMVMLGLGGVQLPPSLTAFTMRGEPPRVLRDGLVFFNRCRLKHFSIARFGLSLAFLHEILQLPSMSGLETLRLEQFDFQEGEPALGGEEAVLAAIERAHNSAVSETLSALPSLHTLHVRGCKRLSPLFEALSHAVALRELIYEPAFKVRKSMRRRITEECNTIMTQSLPELRLTLMLQPSERIPDTASTAFFTDYLQARFPLRARVRHSARVAKPMETALALRDRQRIIVLPSRPIEQDTTRFAILPIVLTRLVFHILPAQEALILARCSRTLLNLADASSAFSVLTLSATRLLKMPLDQSHAGLLRHVPFRLVFPPDEPDHLVRDLIPCLHAHPHFQLSEFNALTAACADWGMSSPRMKAKHCALFRCPAFQSTKVIVMSLIDETLFQTLSQLPRVERLRVSPEFWASPAPSHFFSRFPSLVWLHVVHPTQINELLPLLHCVPTLRTLLLQPMEDATLRLLHQHRQHSARTLIPLVLVAVPTASALIALLDANPALCITLVSKPCPKWDTVAVIARRQQMHTALKAVRDEIPQRYHERLSLPAPGELR